MAGLLEDIKSKLRDALAGALAAAVAAGDLPEGLSAPAFTVEPPRERAHGDFAANLALVLAGAAKRPPRQVAEALVRHWPAEELVDRLEVAGPGFINFFLRPGWCSGVVDRILQEGAAYGRSDRGRGLRVQVEFVSANPTGPLNVVNARAAAFGDALANCLEAAGYRVEREFYINDAGAQFGKLALAMEIRARQALGQDAELPEGVYPGEYVAELAREYLAGPEGAAARRILAATHPRRPAAGAPGNLPAAAPQGPAPQADSPPEPGAEEPAAAPAPDEPPELTRLREAMGRFAVERIVAGQREVLEHYGVVYDVWYRESDVRAAREPERALEMLRQAGHTYEADGAVWFRSTAFGDDQDRVLVRQNGEMTYFLADIGYHLNKFGRGFHKVIDIWGQDHHGYVLRMKAAMQALGRPPGALEVLITQLVRLVRGGQAVKMSKRRGEFVTMEEFVDEVGRDAARFFFLMRSIDSHMDFDLDLARRQAADNPVYYVQYAHARICSILRQAAGQAVAAPGPGAADPTLLRDPAEDDLLRKLAEFPDEVAQAAEKREPHRLTVYARDLATLFHAFYTRCRVLGEEPPLTAARLALCEAARRVLANALALLGVSAPERM